MPIRASRAIGTKLPSPLFDLIASHVTYLGDVAVAAFRYKLGSFVWAIVIVGVISESDS